MNESDVQGDPVDLLIVGGGINGVGIARDAVGRGLSVLLVEKDDLAAHTSSASTKLVHGGLRYLEYGEFRLVRESLIERERLLGMAPHIIWPLEFALPMLNAPRPAWMIRLGLFLYDHLGGRKILPATRGVRLDRDAMGNGLKPGAAKAYVYSDCWVDDARLVALNALDAKERGADIRVGAMLVGATRNASGWTADIEQGGTRYQVKARALVNAAGPWVAEVLQRVPGTRRDRSVKLVKGSHIIVPRLYDGDHAFLLQNDDKRVVFTIPYEGKYTLVGTTDELWNGAPGKVEISAEEVKYLCATVDRYFTQTVTPGDIVWSYAGIRPLYDDSSANASAVTRDYVLDIDKQVESAPMLSIFGGKITTYRKLAEHALEGLAPWFPQAGAAWTAGNALPGGDMPGADFGAFLAGLVQARPGLPQEMLRRLARAYGTRVSDVLGTAQHVEDLGRDFGGGLYQAEVDYLVKHEWARSAQDILYRRSKLGLHLPTSAAGAIDEYLAQRG